MREKQRFLIYKWKYAPKINFSEFESIMEKDLNRQLGDFGLATCGPRFKLFAISTKGFVVKVRIEAHRLVADILQTFKTFQLVHISGSAGLARKAIGKKFKDVAQGDLTVW